MDTSIVFPARNESWIVAAASHGEYAELLAAGVKVYEFVGGLLHTKSLTLDGVVALIGSVNMDRRSFELNYENNILFCDPVLSAEVDGYIRSSDGSLVTSGSGDCVRTTFKDSMEYPEECGYERVVEKAAAVESGATGTDVTIVESAGVVKGDEMVAVTDVAITEVTINNVEFAIDSAELSPAYKAELDTASEFLRPHRSLLRQGLAYLDVIGYTDSSGNDAYNQKLSERRANDMYSGMRRNDEKRINQKLLK